MDVSRLCVYQETLAHQQKILNLWPKRRKADSLGAASSTACGLCSLSWPPKPLLPLGMHLIDIHGVLTRQVPESEWAVS